MKRGIWEAGEDATQCRQLCILSDKTAICQRKWLELELCYIHLLAIAKVEILTVRKYYSNQRYARISTNVHQKRYNLCKVAILPILKCKITPFSLNECMYVFVSIVYHLPLKVQKTYGHLSSYRTHLCHYLWQVTKHFN